MINVISLLNSLHCVCLKLALLRVLTACRLACSYSVGMFSFSKDPTNAYLLHHASPAFLALEVWWGADPIGLASQLGLPPFRT